ncbi:pyruvate kinase-like protein [Dichotomopilus funicola]|uniref:Pyruvate kinase-like protein n=1 Tax=Dichotomopilus funicola TaxID=1934379 RepID=A0AAN6ZQV3_9PEZI|nr:pyruvate kinase-like protein [Dichotomopilus funicola]
MSVHALALSANHEFTKPLVPEITLLTGLGVEGDCHLGATVQHRSRLHISPPPPNLRQVHLIPKEILDQVDLQPGQIGENIATLGIDLLSLGKGTKLHFLPAPDPSTTSPTGVYKDESQEANHPIVTIQGLRNPCPQIDKFRPGLKERFVVRDEERKIVGRRAGVMGTVERGGKVVVGMRVVVEEVGEEEGGFVELGCV